MSQRSDAGYAFPGLPVQPVDPGTNLLVAGDPFAGTTEVALRLLGGGQDRGDGVLLLAADDSAPDLIDRYETAGGTFDRSRMAVVECSGQDRDDRNVRCVASPSDLTGIGIEFASLYEDLYGHGIRRVRTGLFTVSTLLTYADDARTVYRFLHTLTGRVQSANGVAACVVDPSATDEQTLNSLAQPFDGRIDVRGADGGGTELRIRGLDDQPEGWQSV